MYKRHPEGTQLELQGITVNIPKVGYVWDFFTDQWVYTGVYSRSPKKSEQYWEVFPLPDWYNKKRKEEERKIIETEDIEFIIEECENYREQEWFRRINGFWFINNGEATYITGLYYFYLNWWKIDVGLPKYFKYDRYRFYHIDYCNQDPFSYGRLEVGPRRMGKTYVGGVFIYEPVSRSKNSNGGLQSKTNEDAKKVFAKAIVSSFRKLPHFFRPVFDTSAGPIPKSEIRFINTSRKGSKIKAEDLEEELESIIDFRASGKFAYDGDKQIRMLHDEIFKTEGVDVYDRYLVVKECLVDNITEEIIGKYMGTSTVEEVEGQLESYERMWKESDPSKRNDNGHTESGLYHYFISAVETRGMDKYGNCDEIKNLQTITNAVSAITDAKKKSDYKRKYPLSIKDAFRPKSEACHYNLEKLEDRYDLLSIIPEKFVRGVFKWNNVDDMTKGVSFVERKNGPFMLHKDIDYKSDKWNQVGFNGSTPFPKNKAKYACGNDSYDHTTTVDGRKSNGANALFYKFNPMDPLNSDKFVCLYCFRPKKPSIFYDDTLKLLWFFSSQMLFEDNKQGIRTFFDGKNCSKFLLHLPDRKEPGIPATVNTHKAIVDNTEEYIEDCADLVDFPDLIVDWVKFDINNTTKFDLGMASGYALLQADRIKPAEVKKESKLTEITEVFRIFKN
jgi:hypothetical protein